jgi:K+-transporting ATPase ATPase A chain
MNLYDILQILIPLSILVVATPVLGGYMAKVFNGEKHLLTKPLGWLERLTYKAIGEDGNQEMGWKSYTAALLIFNLLGLIFVFGLQLLQSRLPLNPQKLANVSWDSAINTAISFVTNTNWQGYSGETAMSYLTQMLGLCVQNFLSAATGIAVLLGLTRGIIRHTSSTIGNFWADMTRTTIYILLPLSLIFAVVLVGQGVVQTFEAYPSAINLEGQAQTFPLGPAASQIAIKQLGTNGGGFFNANSAHPFENPTPLTNLLELVAILLIPAALVYSFGVMIGNKKHGWVIWTVMFVLLSGGLATALWSEYSTPNSAGLYGSVEGKETRLGTANCVAWAVFTTAASNGSVNCAHESLSPIAGGVALLNLMLGEIIYGGVGVGLTGMILFIILTVFLSGLMIGRTPEYLGKKIGASEVQMTMVAIIVPSLVIKVGTAVSLMLPVALASLSAKGPHGFTEMLYAFTSAGQNNGSAFAGINANTPYMNLALGFTMIAGRLAAIVPVLAIAGSLAAKKSIPPSQGSFNTDNPLFFILLISVVMIVGVLTYLPALALGPIIEHFLVFMGKVF